MGGKVAEATWSCLTSSIQEENLVTETSKLVGTSMTEMWHCLQEQVAALEDRLHVLRRMNSQLERSESNAQQRTANAQHQVQRPQVHKGIKHIA